MSPKQAYMPDSPQALQTRLVLVEVLGMLRALYLLEQTAHWQAQGASAYADHQLFERLYTGVVGEVDTLAEKMVGYFGTGAVDVNSSMLAMSAWLVRWNTPADDKVLRAERDVQEVLARSYTSIKALGGVPLGLDDFLMGLANDHETAVYLLQQRFESGKLPTRMAGGGPNPPVAPSAESHFYDAPRAREVRDFAQSGAMSNVTGVGVASLREMGDSTTSSKAEARMERESPPTPVDVVNATPGGGDFSTLSRYVLKTDQPTDKGVLTGLDEAPKHPKLASVLELAWFGR